MYPQSYELKNFSYDAYLRLILSGSTGEALQADDNSSIYTRILDNSSITTGLALIILDMIAVYAIPALKLFFIIAIFFMSILMILSATVKIEINLARVLKESLLAPLIKFLGISVGMALIVSLFMSNGYTVVTHRTDTVISLGDPVMVILVMIIINVVVLVLYYKTVKKVAKDCVKYAKAVGSSVVGMGGGVFSTLASSILAGKIASSGNGSGLGKTISDAHHRGLENRANKAKTNISRDEHRQNKRENSFNKQQAKVEKLGQREDKLNQKIEQGRKRVQERSNDFDKAKRNESALKNNSSDAVRKKASKKRADANNAFIDAKRQQDAYETRINKKIDKQRSKTSTARLNAAVKGKRAGGKKSV